jgi:hypothetical protein
MTHKQYTQVLDIIKIQINQIRRERRQPKFILVHYLLKKELLDFVRDGIINFNYSDGLVTCFGFPVIGTYDFPEENMYDTQYIIVS